MHHSNTLLGFVKIDDDGRLVIPPEIQEQMGWMEGTRLEATVDADGRVMLRPVVVH